MLSLVVKKKPLPVAVVLGGLEGVKRRLANPVVEQKIAALEEALKYGEAGLELLIWALEDKLWKVRQAAYALLATRQEPIVQEILQEYGNKIDRYDAFVAMARTGGVSDVDTLMDNLESDRTSATCKLVDYTLGLVNTHEGKDRIRYYLFNGTQIQRNYAGLYFKRRGEKSILIEAVKQGCIDKLQAFSK
ncbi:GUN4 domain protein [Calothrix sp. NIES-2100]|nr:GUN4 domain protein [Calothrix sp. NIES-2100]